MKIMTAPAKIKIAIAAPQKSISQLFLAIWRSCPGPAWDEAKGGWGARPSGGRARRSWWRRRERGSASAVVDRYESDPRLPNEAERGSRAATITRGRAAIRGRGTRRPWPDRRRLDVYADEAISG